MSDDRNKVLHSVMRTMRRMMPENESGENQRAVQMFHFAMRMKDIFSGKSISSLLTKNETNTWPVTSGSYLIGEKEGAIAVCTLTSPELMQPLSDIKGVAITGRLVTVNLGIEKIILNVISNPNIRFLLLCGKESPVFHTAQGVESLFKNGVDSDKRIIGAEGHYPVLKNISSNQIEIFRKQCELIDKTEEKNIEVLQKIIMGLDKMKFQTPLDEGKGMSERGVNHFQENSFKKLLPGGRRKPIAYDPNGFFIITIDRTVGEIVVKHYLPDNTPRYEMRGKRAESIIRGLIREKLISQMSHAGYLGVELGKAETALRLNLPYEQDHPISKK